ncbi:zinc metalloprotease [Sphaerisporangium krabiense]|uniref:Zn-dependent metalloprotease n=1 Tax=Sphaerisporangium krabiense TaxID=763782 RepID=A0A7W9DN48_9ACTN|nr:M4 family metallopeptidase [Sphaerisporangium krabiense]MBB5624639.1 Zn-dependent metalloprotease [Sphaerisporangium krabiense]GII61404.1 zinc metalloprotease [Sphaerisporangium krabiense]
MRRRALFAAAVGLAVVTSLTSVTSATSAAAKPPPGPAARALPADPLGLATRAADQAAAARLDQLRTGVDEVWHRARITPGAGGLYFAAYERTYKGLPVVGGDAVVVVDSAGRVRETIAASGPTTGVPTTATVPAAKALATARTRLDRVDDTRSPRLVVFNPGSGALLAWEATVAGIAAGKPSIQHVYVDARTGEIAGSQDEVHAGTGTGYYNGQVTIETSGSGATYRMLDPLRPGVQCGGQDGAPYAGPDDDWGNGLGTNLETACVDVLYGVQRMYDMLRNWLGFNGFDGAGHGIPARVGLNDMNAYWNGTYASFGHNSTRQRQLTAMDVVAHEYGHAVFHFTPGNTGTSLEVPALNEGTGDIFGALTEHYAANATDPPDYVVGELDIDGGGPLEYMYNPSLTGHYSCYSSSIDWTKVHEAGGPLSHWFYLLAEGSAPGGGKPSSPLCSGAPPKLTGIGIQKAGKIFMGALQRKTSTWRYYDVRRVSMVAAVQLYGAGSPECVATRNAWAGIGVPPQSGEPQCTYVPPDFSLAPLPASGYVYPGGSVSLTIATQTVTAPPQAVALTASGLPSGMTATFTPASVTSGDSASLTIAASAATPDGNYLVAIKGTGPAATHTVAYAVVVSSTLGERTFRNDTDYPIPDNATISSPLTSTATGNALSQVQVIVTIAHPCASDLAIRLRGPDGPPYTIVTSGTAACAPFGTRAYLVPVTQQAAGTWTLEVSDDYRKDTGVLDGWKITV